MANKILDFPFTPDMEHTQKARKLANSLYEAYKQEPSKRCGDLIIENVKNYFWGALVKDMLPIFDQIWNILHAKKHTKNNPFVYGCDKSFWVEYPQEKDKKVIISKNYFGGGENNTYIYIRKYNAIMSDLRVASVWPRQIIEKFDTPFGDDRDISKPSLNTYRKKDYTFGYFDCRDMGHVLNYNKLTQSVENAHESEEKIKHSMWLLEIHLESLKAQYNEKKS